MKYLLILTLGVCLLAASVPAIADQTDNVKVAFIARAKVYAIGFHNEHRPKNDGDVIVVMRVEGPTIENVKSEKTPYLEFNGVKEEPAILSTGRKEFIDHTKGGEKVTIDWIVFVFAVPETQTELKLVIDKCAPVTISAPTEVLEKLSDSDIK